MRILVIAPNSYPVDSAEAIVNIKLLKAFTEDGGFEIDLISRKNMRVNYPSDPIESYGVKIDNLFTIENQGGFSFKVLVDSLHAFIHFGIIFPGCHWAYRALPIAKRLVKENHYDFVLTKNSPSLLIGAYLKRKYGLKWIGSWNDPSPTSFYPAPYGKGKDHKPNMEESMFLKQMQKADFHVFPNNRLKDYMRSYLHVDEDICYVAPHIVIENVINSEGLKKENNGTLKIIHSGNLLSPRKSLPIVNALCRIVTERPDVKFHFTFLGKMENSEVEYISSMSILKKVVSVQPAVEYKKSLEILESQDVACVIEADCGEGNGVFLPTKVTDFMQIHKPIFAISPKRGVLEDLYNEKSVGYFADIHNETSIFESILSIYKDFIAGTIKESFVPNSFRPEAVVDVYKRISKR